eukprot:gene17682-21627_t
MSRRNQPSSSQRLIAGFLVLTQFFWLPPSRGASFYWDSDENAANNVLPSTGLGGTGNWNLSTGNWWDGVSPTLDGSWLNAADTAIFTGTSGLVTLSSGIVANRLDFASNGYVLTGGDLTLQGTAPTLSAGFAETATINSLIQGVAGLTKAGGGTVRLGNTGNTYTGITTISNGSLIISGQG